MSDVMYHVDTALEMAICRHILVIPARRAIVGEAQSLPISEVHIQQSLICPIEAYSPCGQCQESIVVTHIGVQDHNPAVETIGPANVWHGSKVGVDGEKLVRGTQRDHVRIDVHQPPKLGLLPKVELCEGRGKVGSIHQVQVRGRLVHNAGDGDDYIVQCLQQWLSQ